MNLLYCGDKNVEKGLMLSALSVANHVSEPLHLYVLTMDMEMNGVKYDPISKEFEQALVSALKEINPKSTVMLLDTASRFEKEQPSVNLDTRFTPYCMLRLYADTFDEIPERILYLDTDVLCRRDPMNFYLQDLDGLEMAGVLDNIGQWFFHKNRLEKDYFNSGVLLLNLKEIRKSGLFEKSRQMCREKKMFMPDQSALNKLVKGFRYWPREYNEQGPVREDTVFQHFTTRFSFYPFVRMISVKPWQYDEVHEVLKLDEYDPLFEQADEALEGYTDSQE